MVFKPKIIIESKHLTITPDLSKLLEAAEKVGENENCKFKQKLSMVLLLLFIFKCLFLAWESDMVSLLVVTCCHQENQNKFQWS